MAQSTPELLPVVQADRDAAARCREDYSGKPGSASARLYREGKLDDCTFVQAFARHRIEHSTPDRNAVLEEAIQAVRGRLAELTGDRRCDDEYRYELNTAISRIRALTTTPKPTDPAGVSEMADELEQFQNAAGLPYPPTPMTLQYRKAVSGEGAGEFLTLGYQWADKPHRLVWDLCGFIEKEAALRTPKQPDRNAVLEEAAKVADDYSQRHAKRVRDTEGDDDTASIVAWHAANIRDAIRALKGADMTLRQQIRALIREWNAEPDMVTAEYTLVQIAHLVGVKITTGGEE